MTKIEEKYQKEIIPLLKQKFNYQNDWAVPRLKKVVLNIGFNPAVKDEKTIQEMSQDLALISGQKPVFTRAKKGIAAFKTRQGQFIGLKVTLRGKRMYDFLEKLIHVALPRSRDFRGLAEKSVDQGGNLNIGIKEQIIFPEIVAEKAKNIFGLEIAVVTTTQKREEGLELFKLLGFPFKKND